MHNFLQDCKLNLFNAMVRLQWCIHYISTFNFYEKVIEY